MKNVFVLSILIVSFIVVNSKAQSVLTADIFSGYFGGSGNEYMTYAATDSIGNVIIAGHGGSTNMPIASAFQSQNKLGPSDGFIAKLNPSMNQLVFSTYLGGTKYDEIKDLVTDSAGNIFVTGLTESEDFPFTVNAYDTVHNGGGFDAFFSKLSPDGELIYSTFLGGKGTDCGMRLAVISPDEVLITGTTNSADFPLVPSVSDAIKGEEDIFLLRLNLITNNLEFSTCFGGSNTDDVFAIKTDVTGNIYLCGNTHSADFPVKAGFDSVFGGNEDGFIGKLSQNGEIIFSSYIGGTGVDRLVDIALNDNNDIYFVGGTASKGLPCSSNAMYSSLNGSTDAIIGKISPAGDTLLYFSYYGGKGTDNLTLGTYPYCWGKLGVLGADTLILTGPTNSNDFTISQGANNKSPGTDMYISLLDISTNKTIYFSYLGGSGDDVPEGLAILNDSTIFISGNTGGTFPASEGAYITSKPGGYNAVFSRLLFREYIPLIVERYSSECFGVFPNPASQTIQIKGIDMLLNKANYKLTDLNGKIIKQVKLESETIDISELPKGIYMLSLNTGEGIITEKIVVE
jgi:hypothetical protein